MKYVITDRRPGKGKKSVGRLKVFSGILIREYEYFYLFQGKNYKFTISKASLACGHYRMRRAGEAAA